MIQLKSRYKSLESIRTMIKAEAITCVMTIQNAWSSNYEQITF